MNFEFEEQGGQLQAEGKGRLDAEALLEKLSPSISSGSPSFVLVRYLPQNVKVSKNPAGRARETMGPLVMGALTMVHGKKGCPHNLGTLFPATGTVQTQAPKSDDIAYQAFLSRTFEEIQTRGYVVKAYLWYQRAIGLALVGGLHWCLIAEKRGA